MELEDRLAIATPEGVRLELTLAGLGSRCIAGVVDLVLKGLIIAALAIVLFTLLDETLAIAIFLPLAFLVFIFYDVLFEVRAHGRTPGKRMTGLRVLRSSGGPVDLRASAIRNLLRIVDELVLWYLPAFIGILVTKRNQRLGDLAGDTIVVRERRAGTDAAAVPAAVPGPSGPAGWEAPTAWDVSAVTRDDVAAVRSFLARRASFSPDARRRLAAQLHAALAPRVGGADEPDPERFLERLAQAKAR